MEVVRSKLSTSEIQYRALTYLPNELLANIPAEDHTYSLFQGFQATLPRNHHHHEHRKSHRRHGSRGRKLLAERGSSSSHRGPPALVSLKTDKDALSHRLEMLGIRKSMSSSEIREIDGKLSNLQKRRRVVLDRLAELEQEEALIERDCKIHITGFTAYEIESLTFVIVLDLDNRIEAIQEEMEEKEALAREGDEPSDPNAELEGRASTDTRPEGVETNETFMSQSMYEKLPSPKSRRHKTIRRKSMPILHEHIEPGTRLNELQAHNDMITALDFDAPFGTMVTAALDDTVRVWDLNAGRCMGMLEGHHASVRCLQVEDNIVATGSADASVRLWDLSRAEYQPRQGRPTDTDEDDGNDSEDRPVVTSSMQDCALFSLEAHVDEVTALYFRGDVLVSGSADKTLRQWDLTKGRCVQTLDVLWAAAQASSTMAPSAASASSAGLSNDRHWRQAGRLPDASADFVGALQCFDAALACGTADGMVRLWDLRSGQVHRSLVGHTGPVTCLQFDDVHLVTGSLDRSIRVSNYGSLSILAAHISFQLFQTYRSSISTLHSFLLPAHNLPYLPTELSVSLSFYPGLSTLRKMKGERDKSACQEIQANALITRYGISEQVPSTTPTLMTTQSRACNSTPAASWLQQVRMSSRCMIKWTDGIGIVVLVLLPIVMMILPFLMQEAMIHL